MEPEKPPRRRKRRLFKKIPPGTAPGTLIPDSQAHPSEMSVVAYKPGEVAEKKEVQVDELPDFLNRWPVTWINVYGLQDTDLITHLGEMLNLHKLALEDVVNVHQRAKMETYGDFLFVVSRMLRSAERLETEQFSMFVGENYVLTFQEYPGDCFDAVRDRIRKGRKVFQKSGPDYLAYALVDAIIDHYFPALEKYDERLDGIEAAILEAADRQTLGRVHAIRKDLLHLRRAVWPMREAVNALVRTDEELIKDETKLYLRDCYDHIIQVIDMLENLREITSGLVDLYHSNIGNRMNEIMKVLTLIATIFIPLSFIAGLYGMNFDSEHSPWNMPELGWYFGYPLALLFMLAVAGVQLYLFKRKGWIGSQGSGNKEERK